jgi:MFS family permease
LFDNTQYAAGVAVGALQVIGVAGLLFVIPVFLQSALDYDSMETGLTLLPYTVALLVASLSSSFLVRFIQPKRLIQFALALMGVGLFLLAATVHPEMTPATLILPLAVYGVAAGLAASLSPNTTLSAVDQSEVGEASSAQEAAGEIGSGFGAAVIGAVLIAASWTGVVDSIADASGWDMPPAERQQLAIQLQDAETTWTPEDERDFLQALPPEVQADIDRIIVEADTEALRSALLVILIVILLALLGSVFLSGTGTPTTPRSSSQPAPGNRPRH